MKPLPPTISRLSWQEYALELAFTVAKRSEEPRTRVGAVVLRHDNSVCGTGYNGLPPGIYLPEVLDPEFPRDKKYLYMVHAEENALRFARPGECYLLACTMLPCNHCLKSIASYGIRTVVYRDFWEKIDDTSLVIADAFKIQLIQIGENQYQG